MLTKRIIPCLDVKSGRVVKGINFKNLKDAGDPVELAKYYYEQGADELVFLDITATNENRSTLAHLVTDIAANIFIPFTVGGGVKTLNEFSKLFLAGADKVSINSAAVNNPSLISEAAKKHGSQAVVVAIDVRKNDNHNWQVYINGGKKSTTLDAVSWAKKVEKLGAGEILLTSMDKDGTNSGYDLELLKEIISVVNIPVVASGGAGNLKDFLKAAKIGSSGILTASVLHYGKYTIKEIKQYLFSNNIPIRL